MVHTATKARAALTVVLVGLSAVGLLFGQDPGPCHEAYLQSGLTEQQLTFDGFRHFYADTLCAHTADYSAKGGERMG